MARLSEMKRDRVRPVGGGGAAELRPEGWEGGREEMKRRGRHTETDRGRETERQRHRETNRWTGRHTEI